MEIYFIFYFLRLEGLMIENDIFIHSLDNMNEDFHNLVEFPELWNIEINVVDVHTFFISTSPVPFILQPFNAEIINIYMYFPRLERLIDNSKIFFFSLYPLKSPNIVYRTNVYKLEKSKEEQTICPLEIPQHVVLFTLYFVYLYKGLVDFVDEDFPISRYRKVNRDFTYLNYEIITRFREEIPLKIFHEELTFMVFIKDCLAFFEKGLTQLSDKNDIKAILSKLSNSEIYNMSEFCNPKFGEIIFLLNEEFHYSIFGNLLINEKMYEICGNTDLKLRSDFNKCCFYL